MPETYTIGIDESVQSVATPRGFLWTTLWNHANNADLKDKRKDPDILSPGDPLFIPDITIKQVPKPPEQTHKFVKKIPLAMLVIKLRRIPKSKAKPSPVVAAIPSVYTDPDPDPHVDEAAASVPYALFADGLLVTEGSTDSTGQLTVKLSPTAQDGQIIFNRGGPQEFGIELNFRQMEPLSEVRGVCKRLFNLGYPCPTDVTDVTADVIVAIQAFQKSVKLPATGDLDDPTRSKLQATYGA